MTFRPAGVLGMETADGTIVPVLDLRTQSSSRMVFTTIKDRQSKALFDFYYREEGCSGWRYLDSLPLNHIPPAGAGEPDLSVKTQVDGQGNLSLQIHDPALPQPSLFVLRAEILGRIGGKSEERPVLGGSTPGAADRRAGQKRSSAPPPPTAPEPSRRKGGAGRLVLPVLALAALFLLVWLLLFDRDPVSSRLQRGGERGPGSGEGRRSAATVEARPVERTEEAAAEPVVREGGPKEEGSAGFSAELRRGAATVQGQQGQKSALAGEGGDTTEYLVTWGDTLWRITERFISDPDLIIAGETLVLPSLLEEERRSNSEEQPIRRRY